MSIERGKAKTPNYPIWELDVLPIATSTDIHPHSSYTDGQMSLIELFDEARRNNLYEKGAIDHGNPVDEDIDYPATFLENYGEESDESYTSEEIYPVKFDNIQDILDDDSGNTTLTNADLEKLKEDLETINDLSRRTSGEGSISELSLDEMLKYSLNYSLVVPHGIEIDYNPAIESAEGTEEKEPIQDYENAIIDFLKKAESHNSGYNYILGSSHYVNTPYTPRYVKKDTLFEEMSQKEKIDVLENYRKKEIAKIKSLSAKLGDMAIPRVSEELMTSDEIAELEEFIYTPIGTLENELNGDFSEHDLAEVAGEKTEIKRPGVLVVGAHPTLIERNEELLDTFREKQQGLSTREEIIDELNHFMYDITTAVEELPSEAETISLHETLKKQDLDPFLTSEDQSRLYPDIALERYYKPIVEAAKSEENFIFEINGKGVERQHPSIMWDMMEEHVFGSDAHRKREQPRRSEKYYEDKIGNKTALLSKKWISQLNKK